MILSLGDLIDASWIFKICFFHRVDAVVGSRQLCGKVSNGLVGWEGPGVVWNTRRSITSQDGKPTEKVIHARILLHSLLLKLLDVCRTWQKTSREQEHILLTLFKCAYCLLQIFLKALAVNSLPYVSEKLKALSYSAFLAFPWTCLRTHKIYSNFPKNSS